MKKFFSYARNLVWLKIFVVFASLSFLLRIFLVVKQKTDITFSLPIFLKVFALGFLFDAITFAYIALAPLLYYTCVSQKFLHSKKHQTANKILYFLLLYAVIFGCFAEIFFWDEFQARFNFIAVDYLIYTTEVVGNIVESYPLLLLLAAIFVLTSLIFFLTYKKIIVTKQEKFLQRGRNFAVLLLLVIIGFFSVDSSKLTKDLTNRYLAEIAEDGIYQLFSAYRNNEIDYEKFYESRDILVSLKELRRSISEQEPRAKFLNDDDIARLIPASHKGVEQKYNVMFVTIESLSADFLQAFGNQKNITPNLDDLANNGLFFTNLYATGTRTVRGLEALSMSIPPTPGNSIVRRQNNENLFNISSPLNERGYQSKFIYGGFGYFDNMNYFFGNNGFTVIDRENFAKNEISFANAWGVSDEDLFAKVIKEADASHAAGKPFLNFVMTTSNHRPFTYPKGKIDIAPKSGRNGAVKYTDYAIGKFVEEAKKKPWFNSTIFVFVADHCAGSAGNTDLPLWRYQIPAIFYAPRIIAPKKFTKIASQIDIVPTLFGLMNLSYESKFFGVDVLSNHANLDRHIFVSTYSDVGSFKENKLYLLKPKKQKIFFDVKILKFGWRGSQESETSEYEAEELEEVIAYYQSASHLFKSGALKNFIPK